MRYYHSSIWVKTKVIISDEFGFIHSRPFIKEEGGKKVSLMYEKYFILISALLGKKGNGKVSKNVLLSQNQGFDLQGISSFKISLDQRHYLSIQNVFQLWWKGIAYLWKKNLKHLLVENSFHSHLDGNTLEGGQKWFVRYKPILSKDNILQRYYMCLECKSFSF